jgi:hypothetical protein
MSMPDCHVCGEPLTDLEQAYDATRDHTSPWYMMLCHKHLDEGDQDALDQLVTAA